MSVPPSTSEVRAAYLAAAQVAVDLVGRPVVADRWDEPSALEGLSVGALAAHLVRPISTVDRYLDTPLPEVDEVDAVGYYLALDGIDDRDSALNRGVAERARDGAAPGPAAVADGAREGLVTVRARLEAAGPDTLVGPFGMRMTLDQYLLTRIIELVVHLDDLAVSLDIPMPALPEAAYERAITTMVEVARRRRGDLGVVRALARRERAEPDGLRVF